MLVVVEMGRSTLVVCVMNQPGLEARDREGSSVCFNIYSPGHGYLEQFSLELNKNLGKVL